MSTLEKLKKRVKSIPSDFTYAEMKTLLEALNYEEATKGKTSGSRVRFFRHSDKKIIDIHKPHPQKELRTYALKQIVKKLEEAGEL